MQLSTRALSFSFSTILSVECGCWGGNAPGTENWSPSSFGSMEQLRYADCIAGGWVGGRRRLSHWIRRIDGGDGLPRDIGRSGSGISVDRWILEELIGRQRNDRVSHFIGRDGSHQIGILVILGLYVWRRSIAIRSHHNITSVEAEGREIYTHTNVICDSD